MTGQGGAGTGETPRMRLVFEGLGADELIRPAQVAAVLTALEEIFLVTLLRDAPPRDHARREWALDYDAQAEQIGLEGLALEVSLHVAVRPHRSASAPSPTDRARVRRAPRSAPLFDRAREDF
jgi:hypothetical protein